jgi:uncharacterized protein YecE (DUF72 family)
MGGQIRVGISGWSYTPWRGNFYPRGLPQRLELAYASRRMTAIEVNGTFYSLQRPSSFEAWRRETPTGFVFAVKGGRYVTHMLKLKSVEWAMANFWASGVLALKEKLGPILWQFPPQLPFDAGRVEAFLELLPRDTEALARAARGHEAWMEGRTVTEADALRPVRHAVEFRHESFMTPRFAELLRAHGVAMVAADVAGKFPTAEDVTAPFVYVRLHGSRALYSSGYSPRELDAWAAKVEARRDGNEPADAHRIGPPARPLKRGRDVFVFFDNTDVTLRAPADARGLAERLHALPEDDAAPAQIMTSLGVGHARGRTPGLTAAGRPPRPPSATRGPGPKATRRGSPPRTRARRS